MDKQLIDKLNKIKFDLAIYENEAEKFSVNLSDKITKTYLEVVRIIELVEIQQLPEPIEQKECEVCKNYNINTEWYKIPQPRKSLIEHEIWEDFNFCPNCGNRTDNGGK